MKICSFLPSATEIVYALGLGESLAGITYECDYPEEALRKTIVVNTRLKPSADPADIDRQVSEFMARGESLYRIETDVLKQIQPDLIVTQDLCHVCAASPGDLGSALSVLPRAPQVINLNPRTLEDVWNDVLTVGRAAGRAEQAEQVVAGLRNRVRAVERAVAGAASRPRVLCLEWLDPPFLGGHWVPEMVERAGGFDVLGKTGEPGFRGDWTKLLQSSPDVIVVMPCGYHLLQAVAQYRGTHFPPGWSDLPAVIEGRVFVVDASSYFSRPGPRLAGGVEILGHILHPERVPEPALADALDKA
ncbi:MAG TPA: cobalamin-binding protein [Terriglobia bacterium]|nr:cobalamin-binding protein [Terriglobia bacterium]